jgi:glucose/arabinose dehydrogenase/PKD repeat protein
LRKRRGEIFWAVAAAAILLIAGKPGRAEAGTVPAGFQDNIVLSGLNGPVNIRFSPDGRVFVAQRNGVLKVFASLSATTSSTVVDLSGEVHNYWDRGLLGLALDPNFPTSPYVYVLYTYNAQPGSTAPVWPGTSCPTPPGATTDGCVVSGRLVRLTLSGNTVTAQKILIQDQWCQQFPSHSIGDLNFGADGALYVSGGDGASFNYVDYGQSGGSSGSPTPRNPCGDPPAGAGGTMTPPTAEGGALRAQSVRRPSAEPALLNGAVLRVDPATGDALPTNPLAGSSDANARRIVAYGFRNPFRFTIRPLSDDLWIGDVGWNTWEEINRQPNPTSAALNFGWPCYEGTSPQPGYQSTGLNLCDSLYSAGTATPPYFTYNHSAHVVSGDSCPTGNSSITGLAFYSGASNYPAFYNNGLFFADYARQCIWFMPVGSNGLPDPTQIQQFDVGAPNPVDLEVGPNGDIFYPDIFGGTIREISYQAGPPDFARGQPTSASSSQTSSLTPDKAVDGDSTTRWSSAWSDNQWWQVDLGAVKSVDTVKVSWETAYASSYKIEVSSDGSTFNTVATVSATAPGWKTTSFTETSARYVRVLGVTRATPYGISFFDAQVFDQGSGGGGTVPANTALPTVSGLPGQGQTLTATTGSWSGSPTSFRYQWQQCDTAGSSCQLIAGATSQTYVLAGTEAGKRVGVLVTATNASGDSQPAVSAVTGVVSADAALNQVASSSSSEAATLTPDKANDGSSATRWSSAWSDNQWWQVDLGSMKPVDTVSLNWEVAYASSYKIQISSDGSAFTTVATVSATSPGWKTTTFTETSVRYVRVLGVTRVTVYGISFWDAQVFDQGSGGGGGGGAVPVNAALPTVSGFVGQGQTLTATNGSWNGSPTSFRYQWQRCDTGGNACQAIAGATSQSYVLAQPDAGQTVRVLVTATNGAGDSQPAASAVTTVVGADLAVGHTTSASSSEAATLTADKANDGNSATRWASTWTDNQWWQVDLGSPKPVDTVFLNWETAYASSYKIQVSSDGSTFTTVATVSATAPGWKTTSFTETSARYVRVLGVTRATTYGISFWDAQVFGPAQSNAPTPVIDSPSSTVTWKVGDPIAFSGHATDPSDGTLPASALTWQLLLHHCDPTGQTCHIHFLSTFTGVSSGSFNAPDHGYPSYLELDLTATDSRGLSTTTSVLLQPQTVSLTLATAPTGLQAAFDATSQATPYTVTAIIGSTHSLSAPAIQTLGGTTYTFSSWSDGGASSHNITASATATTYTATYTGSAGNSPPTAVATASPTSGDAPLTVNFDGSGSSDPDVGDTISYSWDLNGDGTFGDSTVAKPSYTYTTAGTYSAVLKVTDNHGASNSSAPIAVSVSGAVSVFGTTTPGSRTDGPSTDSKEVSKFTAPATGNVTKMTGYISGRNASPGSQPIRAVIYADSGSNPGALLGVSNEVIVQAGQAWGWVDFTFPSPVAVQPGRVWMGYIVGAFTGTKRVIQLRYDPITGDEKYNKNPGGYAAGPSNPFGAASTSSAHYSIYATYG